MIKNKWLLNVLKIEGKDWVSVFYTLVWPFSVFEDIHAIRKAYQYFRATGTRGGWGGKKWNQPGASGTRGKREMVLKPTNNNCGVLWIKFVKWQNVS